MRDGEWVKRVAAWVIKLERSSSIYEGQETGQSIVYQYPHYAYPKNFIFSSGALTFHPSNNYRYTTLMLVDFC